MSEADIRTRLSAAGYDPQTVQHVLAAGGYVIAPANDLVGMTYGFPGGSLEWPYPDLKLCTPHCPLCGCPGVGMLAPSIYPMLWCQDDECEAMSWDPTKPARELIENAAPATIHEQEGPTDER